MNTEKYKIIPLPKEQWKNTKIPMRYTTHEYYDVKIAHVEKGYQIKMEKTKCDPPISHYPEEGEPDYYPLHGFQTCDKFGITTMDGKNFDGFMGIYQKLSGA